MTTLSAQDVPYTGPYSRADGPHRSRGPTAKALKIAMKRMGQEPFKGEDNASFDEHYNDNLEAALDRTTNASWDGYGEKRWEAVRSLNVPAGLTGEGEWALNKEARDLIKLDYSQMHQPTLPSLGPLYKGGALLLDYAPTHQTGGIPLFPAFDTAFKAGTSILAPEKMVVDTKDSSSNPGDAFYATGESKIRYWFGHLVQAPPLGKHFNKGNKVGVVLNHSVGGGPHCHCGVNVEALWGKGKQLEWGENGNGPDYTYGSPTIRVQLSSSDAFV